MSNYYEIFSKRSKAQANFSNYANANAARNFERLLKTSPNAVNIYVNQQSEDVFRALTLSENEDESQIKRLFLTPYNRQLQPGDFIYWNNMIWLITVKVIDTIEAYNKYEAIRCQETLIWITKAGVKQSVPAYISGQMSKMIKDNYQNNGATLTSAQPNNYLMAVTSRRQIEAGERFIIGDLAWRLVDTDYISAPGLIYLSLTEDKLKVNIDEENNQDDLQQKIADIIDWNRFEFEPQVIHNLEVGKTYILNDKVLLNGNYYTNKVVFESDSDGVQIEGNTIICSNAGSVTIVERLIEDPTFTTTLEFTVEPAIATPDITYIIDGDSSIKLGRTKILEAKKFINNEIVNDETVIWTVEDDDEFVSYKIVGNSITLLANCEGKLGTIKIKAQFNNALIEKEISIISAWM